MTIAFVHIHYGPPPTVWQLESHPAHLHVTNQRPHGVKMTARCPFITLVSTLTTDMAVHRLHCLALASVLA